LKTALRRFGSASAPRLVDGESLYPGDTRSLVTAFIARARPNLAIVCAKPGVASWLANAADLPEDVEVWGADFIGAPAERGLIRDLGSRYPLGVVAVTDLDPLGLAQRLNLRADPEPSVVVDGGIDDAWLSLIEADLRSGRRIDDIMLRLTRGESSLLRDIDSVAALEGVVGPRSAAVLRAGLKIELEGATNPGLYRRRHVARLHRLLRARAAAGDRGQ